MSALARRRTVAVVEFTKNVRQRWDGSEGEWECPYECAESFPTAEERLKHLFTGHRDETAIRVAAIERRLNVDGSWRGRAACIGIELVVEPSSHATKQARDADGTRQPTAGEAAAATLCATCPVRRECAAASLNPSDESLAGPGLWGEHARRTAPAKGPAGVCEEFGIWAGVRAEDRFKIVEAFGTGPGAVDVILAVGERMAKEYPGDLRRLRRLDGSKFEPVKHSHLRGRRGQKGPYQLYADEHGVSKSTAWRRLRRVAA